MCFVLTGIINLEEWRSSNKRNVAWNFSSKNFTVLNLYLINLWLHTKPGTLKVIVFSSYSIKYKYFNVLCFYCRCASDLTGLKDQSTTNNIVHKFILHYNDLFADENEPGVSARNTEVSMFFFLFCQPRGFEHMNYFKKYLFSVSLVC